MKKLILPIFSHVAKPRPPVPLSQRDNVTNIKEKIMCLTTILYLNINMLLN